MGGEILGRRVFTPADQERFATLSGDRNPMHMEPVAARRTQAGAVVVHGVHTLLWALEKLAEHYPNISSIAALRVRFDRLVYVGDQVEVFLFDQTSRGLDVRVAVSGAVTLRLAVTFGQVTEQRAEFGTDLVRYRPSEQMGQPRDLALADMTGCAGHLEFAVPQAQVAAEFPQTANMLGASRVAAVAGFSYLVGMVCPGLHSMFGGFSMVVCNDFCPSDGIYFRVVKTDERFRAVRINVAGSGVSGTIESFARHPPSAQPTMAALARCVSANEFAGSTALVVGGSRGLGALTAKLLAAGGARVIVSYVAGLSDAESVRMEITAGGGYCRVVSLDVRKPVDAQLADVTETADALFYFATPQIFRQKSTLFGADRLSEFLAVYVNGFYDVCQSLLRRRPAGISVFYPSSVAAATRPRGLTEYAMSKLAGETLCADMCQYMPAISITQYRLPRLPTDQTATLVPVETEDPTKILLPLMREVHANRFHREMDSRVTGAKSVSGNPAYGSHHKTL